MKNLILSFLASMLMVCSVWGQVPQAFKYQTVVRDANGQILANQAVTLGVDLIQNSNTVYSEDHNAMTNDFGLVNLEIGRGDVVLVGVFNQIDWSVPTSISIFLDPTGGGNVQLMGTSELLSVPYAMHAMNGGGSGGSDNWGNQVVQSDGTLNGDGTAGSPLSVNAGAVNTDNQTLAISGNELSISGGNSVTLPGGGGGSPWQDAGSGSIIYNPNGTGDVTVGPTGQIFSNDTGGKANIRAGHLAANPDIGFVGAYDAAGQFAATMGGSAAGGSSVTARLNGSVYAALAVTADNQAGRVETFGPGGLSTYLGGTMDEPDKGQLFLNSAGTPKVNFFVEPKGSGGFAIGGLGTDRKVTFFVNDQDKPVMRLNGNGEEEALFFTANDDGKGIAGFINPAVGNFAIAEGDGFVLFGPGGFKGGLLIDGSGNSFVAADVKNFRMDDPANAAQEIWYASLEGPEAGAYERGTAQMVNGEAVITFSDHFRKVINPNEMTVMLTPLSADSKGMAVVEKTATGFKVKELYQGNGSYGFDWEVKSIRKGFEDYQVIRQKRDLPQKMETPQAPAARPAPADERELLD